MVFDNGNSLFISHVEYMSTLPVNIKFIFTILRNRKKSVSFSLCFEGSTNKVYVFNVQTIFLMIV